MQGTAHRLGMAALAMLPVLLNDSPALGQGEIELDLVVEPAELQLGF